MHLVEPPPNNEMQQTRPGFAWSLAADLSVLRSSAPRLQRGDLDEERRRWRCDWRQQRMTELAVILAGSVELSRHMTLV
jgi:hypothetical protein